MYRPGRVSSRSKLTEFLDNQYRKVAMLSAAHWKPLLQEYIPGTHFCYRLSRPQDHNGAGRIKLMKNRKAPSGSEPATFRLVAQYLKQLLQRVPQYEK